VAEVEFRIGEADELLLLSFKPFPNPSTQGYLDFEFSYENARPEEDLGFLLNIYNSQGQIVKSFQDFTSDHNTPNHQLRWNYNSDDLKAGVYLYRFFLRSVFYDPGKATGRFVITR
jgi:hypothetical protein